MRDLSTDKKYVLQELRTLLDRYGYDSVDQRVSQRLDSIFLGYALRYTNEDHSYGIELAELMDILRKPGSIDVVAPTSKMTICSDSLKSALLKHLEDLYRSCVCGVNDELCEIESAVYDIVDMHLSEKDLQVQKEQILKSLNIDANNPQYMAVSDAIDQLKAITEADDVKKIKKKRTHAKNLVNLIEKIKFQDNLKMIRQSAKSDERFYKPKLPARRLGFQLSYVYSELKFYGVFGEKLTRKDLCFLYDYLTILGQGEEYAMYEYCGDAIKDKADTIRDWIKAYKRMDH